VLRNLLQELEVRLMNVILVIGAILALGAFYVLIPVLANEYRKYRGKMLVTCPETRKPAAVDLKVGHAALTATFGHRDLELKTCTRWPERQDCGQECLRQIERAPHDCLVRTIVAQWYAGKRCGLCDQAFDSIESWGHQLALMTPDGSTTEWGSIPAEQLPAVFTTHKPVCWNCHIAESFRRAHPELVVDRERPT
jgi:hypothetical protein